METRYDKEAAFHDALAEGDAERSAGRFYAINRSSWAYYRAQLLYHATRSSRPGQPARILEYGSGVGSYSALALAEAGYPSVGIDLSPASVRRSQERAAELHPDVPIEYRAMNAESLDFEDDTFDLVCGNGILHHLDLERAYSEVARVLKPDGVAVFSEPLGENPLINLYRRLTPGQRTEDEHPLTRADVELARRWFDDLHVRYFHLTALAATPLRKTSVFEPTLRFLDRVDRTLFERVEGARRFAWVVVYRVSAPRGKAATGSQP
jgi:SAM-dependent methyltransferase